VTVGGEGGGEGGGCVCRKLYKENNSLARPDIVKIIKIKSVQMGRVCSAHRKDRIV